MGTGVQVSDAREWSLKSQPGSLWRAAERGVTEALESTHLLSLTVTRMHARLLGQGGGVMRISCNREPAAEDRRARRSDRSRGAEKGQRRGHGSDHFGPKQPPSVLKFE